MAADVQERNIGRVKQDSGSIKRRYFIDIIQVLSMIFIVLSHSVPSKVEFVPKIFVTVTPYLQKTGLAIFMWASSWLAVYTNQLGKYGYRKYVLNRALRLLVPYFALNIIMILPKFLIDNNSVSLNILQILYQLITPREGILPHLWFLPTLFFLSLSLPLLLDCLRSKVVSVILFVVAALCLMIPSLTNILCVNDVFDFFVWFVLGVVCAKQEKLLNNPVCLILCGLGMLAISILFSLLSISVCFWFFYALGTGMALVGLSLKLEKVGFSMDIVKKYTFTIYLLSLPVQNIMDILLSKFIQNAWIIYIALFVFGVVVPLIIGIIVRAIEKNNKIKILSKIIGV